MSEPNYKIQKITSDAPESQVYESIRTALADARTRAFSAINSVMVTAYWEIGREIAEAIDDRAEYGKQLLQFLSERLMAEFGNNCNRFTGIDLSPKTIKRAKENLWDYDNVELVCDDFLAYEFMCRVCPDICGEEGGL